MWCWLIPPCWLLRASISSRRLLGALLADSYPLSICSTCLRRLLTTQQLHWFLALTMLTSSALSRPCSFSNCSTPTIVLHLCLSLPSMLPLLATFNKLFSHPSMCSSHLAFPASARPISAYSNASWTIYSDKFLRACFTLIPSGFLCCHMGLHTYYKYALRSDSLARSPSKSNDNSKHSKYCLLSSPSWRFLSQATMHFLHTSSCSFILNCPSASLLEVCHFLLADVSVFALFSCTLSL